MLSKTEFKKLSIIFIIWRSALFLIGSIANTILSYLPSFPYAPELAKYGAPQWLFSWANFDGVHYLTIIDKGYFGTGLIQAFFPLFPLTIKYLNLFNNSLVTGLIVSNLLSFILILSFYQFTKRFFPKKEWLSLFILLLFPTSFFFGAYYTESLFLILVLNTFIMADKRKWLWAGILAGLASATRIIGIILVPALLFEYFFEDTSFFTFIKLLKNNFFKKFLSLHIKDKLTKKSIKPISFIMLGSIGLLSYMTYLFLRYDDPLYFFHVQSEFGGGRQETLIYYPQVLYRSIKILITARPFDLKYFAYVQEFIAGTIGLILLLLSSKKVRLSHLLFVLGAFFVPTLTGTFSSMSRYILICWPIFFVITDLLKNKLVRYSYFLISLSLLILNTILFIQGYWVA